MSVPDYLSANELKRLFPGISKACLARSSLGPLPDPKREPNQRSQSEDRQLDKSREGVAYCITIISLRRKLVDGHDNLRTGAKPLVDQITRSLGFASDDNPRLTWQYGQLRTEGEQGTAVVIERR